MQTDDRVDFAISYAGEDGDAAGKIDASLRELGFELFFARRDIGALVGSRGDLFFEELFTKAKQVIVMISEHYKMKEWTQLEWDVIKDRNLENRFIPVRLDDTRILGLPSTVIYVDFRHAELNAIIETAVKKLLAYEKSASIKRQTDYERILDAIRNNSEGALAQAYQLVKDGRKRDPLESHEMPPCSSPQYTVVEESWPNFSVVKRLSLRVTLPKGFPEAEVVEQLKHCAITFFNAYKPDALMIFGYFEGDDTENLFTAGKVTFAPFGKWDKAQDGVAYNIPSSEFRFSVEKQADPIIKFMLDLAGDESE